MEKLLETGKVKAIGVANFSKRYLEELLKHAKVVPAVNQIENHPYLPQQEILDFCKEKGIHVTAYSPFGSTGGPLLKEEAVQEVAQKHGVTPGTILLSYHCEYMTPWTHNAEMLTQSATVAQGHSVLAKSVTPSRIEENLKVIDLDKSDLDALSKISKEKGFTRYVYPAFGVSCPRDALIVRSNMI